MFTGFEDYKKAFELADVVLITAPPGPRPFLFGQAIKAGKHVFMEKPVATDAPGVRCGLAAGSYELRCRTIDANGVAQPMPRPFPKSGKNGIQKVTLEVV